MPNNNNRNNKLQGPGTGPNRYSLSAILGRAFADGEVECNRTQHFMLKRNTLLDPSGAPLLNPKGNVKQLSVPVLKDLKVILNQMPTGSKASCACERAACEWQWHQPPFVRDGTFASRYVLNGSYTMGISGQEETGRRVYYFDHALSQENMKVLISENPNKYFVTGNAHHDHPLAHARTKLNSISLLDRVVSIARSSGATPEQKYQVLDLFGNPRANQGNNRRFPFMDFKTICNVQTPKDAIRKVTKWGDATFIDSDLRDVCGIHKPIDNRIAGTKAFISVHTLYYLEKREVCALLNACPGSVAHFVVHRHEGDNGTINNGEQKWHRNTGVTVDEIVQTNVLTGEKYRHPALDFWFENDSWFTGGEGARLERDVHGIMQTVLGTDHIKKEGMSWTTGMLDKDTYLITATACDPKIAALPFVPRDPSRPRVADAVDFVHDLKANCIKITIEDEDHVFLVRGRTTFNEARKLVSGKSRDADSFKDHLAKVKRLAKTNDDTPEDTVMDCAMASFFVDYDRDAALIKQTFERNDFAISSFKHATNGVFVAGQRNLFTKVLGTALIAADSRSSAADKLHMLGRVINNVVSTTGSAM